MPTARDTPEIRDARAFAGGLKLRLRFGGYQSAGRASKINLTTIVSWVQAEKLEVPEAVEMAIAA